MPFVSTPLTNIASPIFTSIGTSSAVTVIYICNAGPNTVLFNLYAVSFGNVASYNNVIYHSVPLTSNDTYVLDTEKLIVDAGDSIWANLTVPLMSSNIRVISTVSTIEI
jgi:hypothetical protein